MKYEQEIRDNYEKMADCDLAAMLGISTDVVRHRRRELGLLKSRAVWEKLRKQGVINSFGKV